MSEKLIAHIQSPGSKMILALDGGRIRWMIMVEVLAEIENLLRQKTGRGNAFQMANYFDFKMAPTLSYFSSGQTPAASPVVNTSQNTVGPSNKERVSCHQGS